MYDNITARIRAGYIKIPICVFLINESTGDVYLFFNNNMTAEEASFIVKQVLGINDEFVLEPALPIVSITDEETSQDEYLNRTFVKLSKNIVGKYTVIKTGTASDYTTDFDRVATLEHKIKKGNINTENIGRNFTGTLFYKVEDNVLPDLYKKYIPSEKESALFGYSDDASREYTQLMRYRTPVKVESKNFTTVKGTTTINLDLVDTQLLKDYHTLKKDGG